MDFSQMLATFQVTELIASLLNMISALLGKDRKYSEQKYFQKIADFFQGI